MKVNPVHHWHQIKKAGDFTIVNGDTIIMACPNCGKELGIKCQMPIKPIDTEQAAYWALTKLTFTSPIVCPSHNCVFNVKNGVIEMLPSLASQNKV